MEIERIMSMNCESLRNKLRELGLDTSGLKPVLRDRLLRHFGHQTDGDDGESINSEYQDVGASASTGVRLNGPVFTLRDIVDSLSTFSGTDSLDIRHWVEDFEENAETVGWNDIQKFIYGKQLLTGAAKSFVRSQSGLKNWESLKNALIDEFGETLSTSEIHKMLRKRRKNQNETYREYLYALMEIGKPINLDVPSLLDYFVEGIPDSRFNKAILYQAKTVEQMKEQIKIYEKIRTSSNKDSKKTNAPNNVELKEEKSGSARKKNCFKCGSPNHLAKDCGETQFKCFKCNGVGHRAADCKVNKPEVKQERSNVNTFGYDKEPFEPGMKFKKVTLGNIEFYGLIDTGCNMCTMRCDVYDRLCNEFQLVVEQRRLKGAGAGVFYTQGYFEAPVVIDGIPLKIRFYVVRAEDLDYPAVLGTNLLQFVDLIIREDGVELVSKTAKNVGRSNIDDHQKYINTSEFVSESVDCVVQGRVGRSDKEVSVAQKAGNTSTKNEEMVVDKLEKSVVEATVFEASSSDLLAHKNDDSESMPETGRKLSMVNICGLKERDQRGFKENRRSENFRLRNSTNNKRTQDGYRVGRKEKHFGSYRVKKRVEYGQYKIGGNTECERPGRRVTLAENMKRWAPVFESNTPSGGPNVGLEPSRVTRSGRRW